MLGILNSVVDMTVVRLELETLISVVLVVVVLVVVELELGITNSGKLAVMRLELGTEYSVDRMVVEMEVCMFHLRVVVVEGLGTYLVEKEACMLVVVGSSVQVSFELLLNLV